MQTMQEFKIKNTRDDNEVVFTGVLLSSASSAHPRDFSGRWHEVHIYRTESGKYVVAKYGKSVVYHRPDCSRVNESMENVTAAWLFQRETEPEDGVQVVFSPCRECRPGDYGDSNDTEADELFKLETDRVSTQICETPRAVSLALYTRDRSGLGYVTTTAKDAMRAASEVDDELKRVWIRQEVD